MTDRPELEPGRNLPIPFQESGNLPAPLPPPPAHFEEEEGSISLEHYFHVLMRRKWLLLAIAITFVLLAALQVFTVTPMYRAAARLQVDPESSRIVPFQEVAGSELAGGWFMENYMWTQTENLKSQGMALRVVRKLDLAESESFNQPINPGFLKQIIDQAYRLAWLPFKMARKSEPRGSSSPRDPDSALASRLMGGVSVKPISNTRLIEVAYTGPDPELAARIVNTLSEEFIESHLEGKFEATSRASDFLRSQLEDLQIQVEQTEQKLLAYAKSNNIVNLSERETIARKRLADMSDELTAAESELIRQQSRYDAAQQASAEELPESLKNEAIRRLEQGLSEAKSRLASFSSRYGSEWPAVKDTRVEIADLERQLAEERRRALNSARQDYRLARDRFDRLETAVAEQRGLVDELNESSIQYNILKREVDSNKELYEGLLQRLKEAGVAAGLRSSNIRISDQAEPPRSRSTPLRIRTMLMALILGLFLGTGLVFLLDALDNTLETSDDVTKELGLPALGVVPLLSVNGGGKRRLRLHLPKSMASLSPRLVVTDKDLPEARALEAYRSLRTALLLSHSGNPPQVILVTSALPGEGKSTTVANTAIALAQTGARTLIMDLDMRRPSLAEAFGISAEQGMSTFLSGNSDISSQIHETGLSKLFLVPAGPKPPNPAELIGSQRMATGMQLMREYFTYVVIDSPPVLELSDAMSTSQYADGVILVAHGGKTPRKVVLKAAENLVRVGGKLLGVLVNAVDVERGSYGYYGYGGSSAYFDRYHQSESDSSKRTA